MSDFNYIPLGLNIPSQIPLDAKQYVYSEASLKNLGSSDQLAFTYVKGYIFYCIQEGTRFEWREVLSGSTEKGLMDNDYVYPDNVIVFGIDYSLKSYNFFRIDYENKKYFQSGSNTTLEGDGSEQNPFKYNADQIKISAGSNISFTGIGTEADPLVINADSFTQQNTDWNAVSGVTELLNKPSNFPPSAHTHSIADIDYLQSFLDKAELKENKGVPLGYVPLNIFGKIDEQYIERERNEYVNFKGYYNASLNIPELPLANTVKGHYYEILEDGTFQLIDYKKGDWIISDGNSWKRVSNQEYTDEKAQIAVVSRYIRFDVENKSPSEKAVFDALDDLQLNKEDKSNKQNSLDTDVTGTKYPTVTAVKNAIDSIYQPDTVIRYTAPTRVGNTFTFPSGGYDVLLSKQFHTNVSQLETTIDAATDGFKRIDLIYYKADDTIAKIQGTESATVAVRPEVPAGGIELCLINVFGATIEVPEVNGAYVQKSERANVVLTGSGVINQLDLVDEKATIVFKDAITRLNTISYASVPYNGKRITLFNAQATPVTIGHSVSGYGVDFVFTDAQDYILLPNQTIEFSFDITYAPYAHHMLIGAKGVTSWSELQGKPSTFPPSAHAHTKSQITDFAHTHPISDVTGLPMALDDLQLNKEDKGVNSSKIAYVESVGNDTTAELGNFRKPFLTIDAALDALPATGGVINIGVGSFMSPTKTKIKSYVKFFGSGKPITNSIYSYAPLAEKPAISSPTKLVGGTILLGSVEVSLKDGIEFHNLGVDSGLDYCNTYKAGVAQEGLIIVQEYNLAGGLPSADGLHQLQTNSPPRTGIVVNNVSALCKTAASPVHAMLVENTINAKISNVSTYYGTYGLVIKSIGCNVNGLDAHGHAEAGLIFKANDYAYGRQNSATNIYVTSIVSYDGGGITFVSEQSILSFVTLTNFNVEFTTYGISNTSSGGMHTEGHTISNGIIYKTLGIGIDIDSTFLNSVFSNIDQRQGTTGYLIRQNYSGIRTFLHFTQCKSSENTAFNWDIASSSLSEVYLNSCNGQSGSSTVSGNVYGNLQESAALTGSMNKSAVAGDFIASIDSKGVSKKSSVTFDGVGGINVTGLLIKKSASNNIGDGSCVAFDNGASGGLQRQIVYQLNASNNIDLWYYNGSVFSLTDIVFKNTGVIKSKVYTVSTLPAAEKGDTSFVSDALSPVFGNTVVGGGAVGVPVYHDGISWKVG